MGLSLVWASSRSISFVCPCCLCPQRSFDILYSRVSRQSVIISVLLLSHPSSSSSSSSSSCQVSLATLVVSAIPSCHFFLFSAALRSESRSAPVRIWWAEVTQGGRVHSCGESPRGSHERRGGRTGRRRRSFEGRAAKYQLLREKLFACAWDVWRWLAAQYCLGLGIYLVSQ